MLNNGSYSQSKTSKEGYKIPSSPESGEITDEDSDAQVIQITIIYILVWLCVT